MKTLLLLALALLTASASAHAPEPTLADRLASHAETAGVFMVVFGDRPAAAAYFQGRRDAFREVLFLLQQQ